MDGRSRGPGSRAVAAGLGLALLLTGGTGGCAQPVAPPTRRTVELSGDPFTRGKAHGQQLSTEIRSFYTTILTASLLPYLGREQPDIATFLTEYAKPDYADGKFSYQLLLDSARKLERSIPKQYVEEMQGIAEGSGLPYEQILVLNTFVDTVLAVRGVALALRLSNAPQVEKVEVVGAGSDGRDNDGDGETDEADEGVLSPFRQSAFASLVELAPDATFRFTLQDKDGIAPESLRLVLDGTVYEAGNPALTSEAVPGDATRLVAVFKPPTPLAASQVTAIQLQAADKTLQELPPPAHPRFMREERFTFSTSGLGKKPWEVRNIGVADTRVQPPSLAFAIKGNKTSDGKPLMAQHFTLLDSNTAHKHTVLFVHREEGKPAVVFPAWPGLVWGFSAMSDRGLGISCQQSDSLDNSVVANLLGSVGDLSKAKLVASGTPIGFALRQALETKSTANDAITQLQTIKPVFGWNCIAGDPAGGMKAVEMDSNLDNQPTDGFSPYGSDAADPESVDTHGQLWGSGSPDDLRITTHFAKNQTDIFRLEVSGARVVPQSSWSGFYYRSVRLHGLLGDALGASSKLDVPAVEALLRRPEFVDRSDSMNAVVMELAARKFHVAMGAVPATDAPFETYDLSQGAR